jgi:hypothetical protein
LLHVASYIARRETEFFTGDLYDGLGVLLAFLAALPTGAYGINILGTDIKSYISEKYNANKDGIKKFAGIAGGILTFAVGSDMLLYYFDGASVQDILDNFENLPVFGIQSLTYGDISGAIKLAVGFGTAPFIVDYITKLQDAAIDKLIAMAGEYGENAAKRLSLKITKSVGMKVAKTTPKGKTVVKFIERNLSRGDDDDSDYDENEFFEKLARAFENVLELIIPGYDLIGNESAGVPTVKQIVERNAGEIKVMKKSAVLAIFLDRVNAKFVNRRAINRRSSFNYDVLNLKKISALAKFLEKYSEESIMLYRLLK